ncbi:AmmeMemoRadiSam system protein B [Aestuariimicrobium ganziense]|uniref:AmmeMemoRadiSam system protein B n=1 Tax=Aestuariimicrobium ganziense TaxID=2773677 RepID=UPI0019453886|nr:AmmeMemoRadiSam system protein B [Aestuariimicrobium ganziense]
MTPEGRRTREPAVAGMFYPREAARLRAEVDELLRAAPPASEGPPPRAFIVPHAGYVYSGHVAAHVYSAIRASPDAWRRVLLLGPTHRVASRGVALPGTDVWHTPLGDSALDTALAARLAALDEVEERPDVHLDEHALEVQLPFLQVVAPQLPVLPVCCGVASPDLVGQVIDVALENDPATLVLASSDLSHYLPDEQARRVDEATLTQVVDLAGPLAPEQACGARAVNGLLVAARARGWSARVLASANSSDTIGDRQRVVGYAAVAFDGGGRS